MPINVMDAHYRSFQKQVVPVCLRQQRRRHRDEGIRRQPSGAASWKASGLTRPGVLPLCPQPARVVAGGGPHDPGAREAGRRPRPRLPPLLGRREGEPRRPREGRRGDGRFELFKSSQVLRRAVPSQAARLHRLISFASFQTLRRRRHGTDGTRFARQTGVGGSARLDAHRRPRAGRQQPGSGSPLPAVPPPSSPPPWARARAPGRGRSTPSAATPSRAGRPGRASTSRSSSTTAPRAPSLPWLATALRVERGQPDASASPCVRACVWSDGAPFSARDVVFTFDLMRRFPPSTARRCGSSWPT